MTERYHANNPKMNLIYNTLARAAEAEHENERTEPRAQLALKAPLKAQHIYNYIATMQATKLHQKLTKSCHQHQSEAMIGFFSVLVADF